jgi:hypothetical protein
MVRRGFLNIIGGRIGLSGDENVAQRAVIAFYAPTFMDVLAKIRPDIENESCRP